MNVAVEARSLTRILSEGSQEITLVEDINLEVKRGEFVAITGPSGSGKSSLLYLLGLLDHPSHGTLTLDGEETVGLSSDALACLRLEKLGFIFQFHFLLPEFSLLENVMIPMRKLARLSEAAMLERATALLHDLGLEGHETKTPDQLSGGQRQRVAIARALANEPLVLLADEPTGSLDTRNGQMVFETFRRLVEEKGQTVITVTHDAHLAEYTTRQIHLVDGRLQA